ncbi:unnamed protein product, partial [Dibothriocephalus latus]
MVQASNIGDTQKLYQIIRQVSGKPSRLWDSVHDGNGGFIAASSAKVNCCHENFEHLLNFDEQTITRSSSPQRSFIPLRRR